MDSDLDNNINNNLNNNLNIEILYASEKHNYLINCLINNNLKLTAREIIKNSRLLESVFKQEQLNLDINNLSIGIWSKPIKADQVINNNCRIEIYRPLKIDPKEARRKRSA